MSYTEQQKMALTKIKRSGSDEWYTPEEAIMPIIKYLPKNKKLKILCPFDDERSNFVKILKSLGHDVNYSSLKTGKSFYDINVVDADLIISNPPYSSKSETIKKLYDLGKPFAMLMPIGSTFETKVRQDCFSRNGVELLILDKRVKFINGGNYKNAQGKLIANAAPPFLVGYFCWKVLPEKIIFEKM